MPLPAAAFPLCVSGAKILGHDGSTVRLAGVNWGGAQQDEGVPYGLDRQPVSALADRLAAMGLNHVRVPFSTGMILTNKGNPVTARAPAYRTSANPSWTGLTPWQVLQAFTDELTVRRVQAGKDPIYVILNNHLSYPGWCCSEADNNGFWYNDNWPASVFISCWQTIAKRFAANPYVGYDIRNEPRPAMIGGVKRTPTWGSGGSNTDFRSMYEVMTGIITGIDPDCLCYCEGLSYAGNLTGWKTAPVRKPNVVASLHDYPFFHKGTTTWAQYKAAMDAKFPDLGVPMWVGEFGTNTDVYTTAMESFWLPWFIQYAGERGWHWCWWELSSTAVKGTEPSTNKVKMRDGQREAFSLMAGHDWLGTQVNLLNMLAPVMPGGGG